MRKIIVGNLGCLVAVAPAPIVFALEGHPKIQMILCLCQIAGAVVGVIALIKMVIDDGF